MNGYRREAGYAEEDGHTPTVLELPPASWSMTDLGWFGDGASAKRTLYTVVCSCERPFGLRSTRRAAIADLDGHLVDVVRLRATPQTLF